MIFVYAIRVLLFLVLLWDIPVVIYILTKFVAGGPHAVHGWIAHIAKMGRPFYPDDSPQGRWQLRSAYLTMSTIDCCFTAAAVSVSTMAGLSYRQKDLKVASSRLWIVRMSAFMDAA